MKAFQISKQMQSMCLDALLSAKKCIIIEMHLPHSEYKTKYLSEIIPNTCQILLCKFCKFTEYQGEIAY